MFMGLLRRSFRAATVTSYPILILVLSLYLITHVWLILPHTFFITLVPDAKNVGPTTPPCGNPSALAVAGLKDEENFVETAALSVAVLKSLWSTASAVTHPNPDVLGEGQDVKTSTVEKIIGLSQHLTVTEPFKAGGSPDASSSITVDTLAAGIRYAASRSIRYFMPDKVLQTLVKKFSLTPSTPLDLNDFLFIIMGSAKHKARVKAMRKSWLHWVDPSNYYIFADEEDEALRMVTLPELKGKGTYVDSGHRQLRGMQYLLREHPSLVQSKKWFMFVDDDTFVNLPLVLNYLSQYPEEIPVAFGYVFDNLKYRPGMSYLQGSAIFMSRAAFKSVAANVYERCPWFNENDIAWGLCMPVSGVMKVHSSSIFFEQPRSTLMHSFHNAAFWFFAGSWGPVYTTLVTDYLVSHHVQKVQHMKDLTCIVSAVYGWPHPSCSDLRQVLGDGSIAPPDPAKVDYSTANIRNENTALPRLGIRTAYEWVPEEDYRGYFAFAFWVAGVLAFWVGYSWAQRSSGLKTGKGNGSKFGGLPTVSPLASPFADDNKQL